MLKLPYIALASLLGIGLGVGSASAQGVGGLAERLAELRADVEQLSQDLSEKQNEQRERLRSLSRQKADLELEKNRAELKLKKLRASIEEQKQEIEKSSLETQDLQPLFDSAADKLRQHISTSLPFKPDERMAALEKIEEQQKSGLVPTERAINRLWGLVEDELRLTRESGLYKQVIALEGEEQMVDVIRMGMVAIYFRAEEDVVGHTVEHDDGSWGFVELEDPDEKKMVLDLFENFRKQIRVGYFKLPNALPEEQ